MKKVTPKLSLNTLLMFALLSLTGFAANAQSCTPVGDQVSYGQDQWLGYVYNNLPVTGDAPTAAAFDTANYKGYITRNQSFNQDVTYYGLPDESTLCPEYYNNYFIIRYKMQKTLPAGYYTYTVGGDDGFRLSFDGGATFAEDLSYWGDHEYISKTATHYHAGGTISYVLEYYEHDGLSRVSFTDDVASCASSAPTSIAGSLTSSCATGTTLTAAGGIAGVDCTYQWGTGNVVGQNVISGQTSVSINVQPLSTKTYWVRRVSSWPCSEVTDGAIATVTVDNSTLINPSIYGDNTWNVYVYQGADIDLSSNNVEYAGYYMAPTLGFDTQDYWQKNSSPSTYSGYTGCSIGVDNFSFVHKRRGFSCGDYTVQMENWDDDSRLYINGTEVWAYYSWSGGAGTQNIGTFYLDENSTIELRTREGGGDANAKLVLTPVTASVNPASISGVTYCCKNATVILTATGGILGTNAEYQWGTGTVGSNVIEGQTAATITVYPLADTTYWVRIKTGCGTFTQGAVKGIIVPTPLVYNGTWNGTPTIETAVEIQTNLVMQSDLEFCSCQVKNNATLTVSTGKTLTVKNKLTVDAGSDVSIENNAALVQIEKIQDEGSIVLHKNSNPLYRLDYTMWSSPVTGQELLAFSPNTNATRFYEYKYDVDPTSNVLTEQYFGVTAAGTNFATAKGYLIRMPNIDTATGYNAGTTAISYVGNFRGVPNNGDVTIAASTVGNRYTAVGNPYPSPISVAQFFSQNAGVLEDNSAMYFWRKKNNSAVSSYATVTLAGYTKNAALGGGAEQSGYFTGNNSNWIVAPGQGFIVRTKTNPTTTNIVFNNTMRKAVPATGGQAFFKSSQPVASRLWLNLTDSTTGFSQAAVAYMDEATLDLDYGYDGQQLIDGGSVSLYSLAADTNLAIQARPAFESSDVVPMGFVANATGSYTIALDHTEGVFEGDQNIYIKDNTEGIMHNLKNSDYTFTSDAGTFTNRFEIVYTTEALGTTTPVLAPNSVIVYKEGATININSGTAEMTGVTVYDIRGRVLFSKNNINANETAISGLQVQNEVLIVNIETVKGKVSKKIVY